MVLLHTCVCIEKYFLFCAWISFSFSQCRHSVRRKAKHGAGALPSERPLRVLSLKGIVGILTDFVVECAGACGFAIESCTCFLFRTVLCCFFLLLFSFRFFAVSRVSACQRKKTHTRTRTNHCVYPGFVLMNRFKIPYRPA